MRKAFAYGTLAQVVLGMKCPRNAPLSEAEDPYHYETEADLFVGTPLESLMLRVIDSMTREEIIVSTGLHQIPKFSLPHRGHAVRLCKLKTIITEIVRNPQCPLPEAVQCQIKYTCFARGDVTDDEEYTRLESWLNGIKLKFPKKKTGDDSDECWLQAFMRAVCYKEGEDFNNQMWAEPFDKDKTKQRLRKEATSNLVQSVAQEFKTPLKWKGNSHRAQWDERDYAKALRAFRSAYRMISSMSDFILEVSSRPQNAIMAIEKLDVSQLKEATNTLREFKKMHIQHRQERAFGRRRLTQRLDC